MQSLTSEFEQQLSRLTMLFRFSHWLCERKVIDATQVYEVTQNARPARVLIGELALGRQWINVLELRRTLEKQVVTGERLGGVAHQLGLLNEHQLALLLAEQNESADAVAENLMRQGTIDILEAAALLETYYADVAELVSQGKNLREVPAATAAH